MFYVTVVPVSASKRFDLLAGPFHTHGAALAAVGPCQRALERLAPTQAPWVAVGTARDRTGRLRQQGRKVKLNEAIGYEIDSRP